MDLSTPKSLYNPRDPIGFLTQLSVINAIGFECQTNPASDTQVPLLEQLDLNCSRAIQAPLEQLSLENPVLKNLKLVWRSDSSASLVFDALKSDGSVSIKLSSISSVSGDRLSNSNLNFLIDSKLPKLNLNGYHPQTDYTFFSNSYWDLESSEPLKNVGLPDIGGTLGSFVRMRSIAKLSPTQFRFFFETTFRTNEPGTLTIHFSKGSDEAGNPINSKWELSLVGLSLSHSIPSVRSWAFLGIFDSNKVFIGHSRFGDSRNFEWSPSGVRVFNSFFYFSDYDSSSVNLGNGRFLQTGGIASNTSLSNAIVFDAKTDQFENLTNLPMARSGHNSTLLENGRVLLTGGYNSSTVYDSALLLDVSSGGSYTATGPMRSSRFHSCSVRLSDGRVWITGGFRTRNLASLLDSTEFYDPVNNTFTDGPKMPGQLAVHQCFLLSDGNVLVTPSLILGQTNQYFLFLPKENRIISLPIPERERTGAAVVPTKDGGAYFFGGGLPPTANEASRVIDRYDRKLGERFFSVGLDKLARRLHTGIQLPNGSILLVGGLDFLENPILETQIFGIAP